LEREVKEAKADVLRLSAEGLLMKETLAAFQQGTNEALEAMVANHQELVARLKVRDNNIKGALARRDEKVAFLISKDEMRKADTSYRRNSSRTWWLC
jgi:uncharacterized coiled-coil protein SlyX